LEEELGGENFPLSGKFGPVVGSNVGVLFFFGFLLCGLAKKIQKFDSEKESPVE